MKDETLAELITDPDPQIRLRGRLVATGILDTLTNWTAEELDRGSHPTDVIEALLAVTICQIGLTIGQCLIPEVSRQSVKRVVDRHVSMVQQLLATTVEDIVKAKARQ